MADLRGLFAPAAALAAGAAFFLTLVPSAADAAELDAPMQPIARDGAAPAPAKRKAITQGDPAAEPTVVRSADRMAPEFPGDPEMQAEPADPRDALVDRTVDAVGSVSATTNSILRLERP